MLDKEEEEQNVEIKVEPIDLSELRLGSASEFLQLRWEQAMPTNWKRTIREDANTQYLVCRQWSESLAIFFSETNVSLRSSFRIALILALTGTGILGESGSN